MNNKTVYILGAGASYSSKIPLQNDILREIYSLRKDMLFKNTNKKSIMDIEENEEKECLRDHFEEFNKNRVIIGEFILNNFSTNNEYQEYSKLINNIEILSSSNNYPKLKNVINESYNTAFDKIIKCNISLEDLFTIFDIFVNNDEQFNSYSCDKIEEINSKFQMCIVYIISYIINFCSKTNGEYDLFSQMLINQIFEKKENATIITTNWDNIFEKKFSINCDEFNNNKKNNKKIYPDYCFESFSVENGNMNSISVSNKRNSFVNILKLHGSISWLECPRCKRMFIDYKKDIAMYGFGGTVCPICQREFGHKKESPQLKSIIITPTFIKSLDNLCLKNIWHRAFLEISSASKIVFVGYSFPDADYEMRSLLKKSINQKASIEVVLSKRDDPNFYNNDLLKTINKEQANKIVGKMIFPEHRYKTFFGGNELHFYYNGFKNYILKERKKYSNEKRN